MASGFRVLFLLISSSFIICLTLYMESIKKLLKTDQFHEIIDNKNTHVQYLKYLVKQVGDQKMRLSQRLDILYIVFSHNAFASKYKMNKSQILNDLNQLNSNIKIKNIHIKVDPSILESRKKPTVKISAHAKNIWNKVHETLEDSPLKDFFLKKHD